MNVYIALGGIAGKIIAEFEKKNPQYKYYYFDSSPDVSNIDSGSKRYIITNQVDGCFQRCIGKDSFKQAIYRGELPEIIDSYFLAEECLITIVTSAFGGFGSAIASDFVDYYGTKISIYRNQHNTHNKAKFRVIAFPTQYWLTLFSQSQIFKYEKNMADLINDFCEKDNRETEWYKSKCPNIPPVPLFVPFSSEYELSDLSAFVSMSNEELMRFDIRSSFSSFFSSNNSFQKKDVFISYSSKDRVISDLLYDEFKKRGISCWYAPEDIKEGAAYAKEILRGINNSKIFVVIISKNSIKSEQVKNEIDRATNRVKDGIMIIPLRIDNCELDEECEYYLCRRQWYQAVDPPIEVRIRKLIDEIEILLG